MLEPFHQDQSEFDGAGSGAEGEGSAVDGHRARADHHRAHSVGLGACAHAGCGDCPEDDHGARRACNCSHRLQRRPDSPAAALPASAALAASGIRRTTIRAVGSSERMLLQIACGFESTCHWPPYRNLSVNTSTVCAFAFFSVSSKMPSALVKTGFESTISAAPSTGWPSASTTSARRMLLPSNGCWYSTPPPCSRDSTRFTVEVYSKCPVGPTKVAPCSLTRPNR